MANRKRLWQNNRIVEVLKEANTEKTADIEISCVNCRGHYETDTNGWGEIMKTGKRKDNGQYSEAPTMVS
jgi:hypothetical protein